MEFPTTNYLVYILISLPNQRGLWNYNCLQFVNSMNFILNRLKLLKKSIISFPLLFLADLSRSDDPSASMDWCFPINEWIFVPPTSGNTLETFLSSAINGNCAGSSFMLSSDDCDLSYYIMFIMNHNLYYYYLFRNYISCYRIWLSVLNKMTVRIECWDDVVAVVKVVVALKSSL